MTDRMPDAVRGVLFDFNGTLVRLASWETHEAVFARHGLGEVATAWGERWSVGPADGAVHHEHSTGRDAYRRWEIERYRSRARACGVGEDRIDDLVADLDRATQTFTLECYEDVMPALARLRARNLVVAICSNWFWDLDQAVADVGLSGAVDVAVTSAQTGARKPHPRVFLETLRRCGLRPREALYVGDIWETDVEGARAVGMRAVHLCRTERAQDDPVPPPGDGTYRISDLRALDDLL